MTTIDYVGNPDGSGEVEYIPVFELFARRVANTEFEGLEPTAVGATRLGELEYLPDAPKATRFEIERAAGVEEVRCIDTTNGTYRSATGDAAKRIIAEWDAKEAELFSDADPDPTEMAEASDLYPGVPQRDIPYFRCIVEYDSEGARNMPLRKRAGAIKTAQEFWEGESSEPYSWVFVGKEQAFWANGRTGEYWVAEGKDLVAAIKQGPSRRSPSGGEELPDGGQAISDSPVTS